MVISRLYCAGVMFSVRLKAVCLIGAVFPITGQIHVLGAEGFQRTVIRQGNGLLQIERYPLLGKSGKGSQTEQKYKT